MLLIFTVGGEGCGSRVPDHSSSLLSFREILSSIESQPNYWLFLPASEPWTLDSRCAVLDTNGLDSGDELPPLAREHDLTCALDVSAVQDIVANASHQLGSPTLEQIFEAFLFYYDNDAFKDFGSLYDSPSRRS